jgi:phosphoglycerol transferase MdoB-like AlkP superfamily enzyme
MNPAVNLLLKNFEFKVGNFNIAPTYWQAGAIVLLLFLLVLTLAQVRRRFLDWSIKGAFFGIFLGFLLALILEGFLILGGKTALTEVLGWKNAPKPISNALDAGRSKLIDVLGVQTEIPSSQAQEKPSYQSVIQNFQNLSPQDAERVRSTICVQ